MKQILNKNIISSKKYITIFLLVVAFLAVINNSFYVFAAEDTTSSLMNADIDNHNFNFSVTDVKENDVSYHVVYTYNTFLVEDNVWKEKPKDGIIIVDKSEVKPNDVMLYITEQFKNITTQEINYLKKVQAIENKRVTMRTSSLGAILMSLVNLNIKLIPTDRHVVIDKEPVSTSTTDISTITDIVADTHSPVATPTTSTSTENASSSISTETATTTINIDTSSVPIENIDAVTIPQASTTVATSSVPTENIDATTTPETATTTVQVSFVDKIITLPMIITSFIDRLKSVLS